MSENIGSQLFEGRKYLDTAIFSPKILGRNYLEPEYTWSQLFRAETVGHLYLEHEISTPSYLEPEYSWSQLFRARKKWVIAMWIVKKMCHS